MVTAQGFSQTINGRVRQSAREEISANRFLCGSNHLDYDNYPATEKLTPAPKGYEPYLMNHYGRHGSRWLIGKGEYTNAINAMKKAREQGKLTAKGKETLQKLEKFYPTTVDRLGDLTTVGERQHHGIGRRMVEHFPEIFKKEGVRIDAKSTVVIRCILSMTAECEEFAAANPTAIFHNDVSEAFQYYLNAPHSRNHKRSRSKGEDLRREYRQRYTHPERLVSVLFNDAQWVNDSIDANGFMRQLFDIANNMQSHETDIELLSLFTSDELYDLWRIKNTDWYLSYAHAPQTDGAMPFSQTKLLQDIINVADTAKMTQAVLRFGHEVCVMPLACLLELGSCGARVENLDTLDQVWRNYDIFPMGCNVQLIFYRPKKKKSGDILVKALLNEREMSLPVKPVTGPYVKWSDLRAYYINKLETNREE
ncbi:MAG: histidine-type phosphatase [Bacteroidaceae bacterium]|nr:histidine-type phosphatase [Bacteroidaceae bacterium]